MKRPRKPREGSESRAARRRLKAADGGRREQLVMPPPATDSERKRSPLPRGLLSGFPLWRIRNLHDSVAGGLHEVGNVGEHDERRPKQHLRLLATHGSSLPRNPSDRRSIWIDTVILAQTTGGEDPEKPLVTMAQPPR